VIASDGVHEDMSLALRTLLTVLDLGSQVLDLDTRVHDLDTCVFDPSLGTAYPSPACDAITIRSRVPASYNPVIALIKK